MSRSLVVVSLLCTLSACAGSHTASTPHAQDSVTTTASATSRIEAAPATAEPAPSAPEPDPGPPPVLSLRGEPERGARTVAIAVANQGTELARIAPAVVLERRDENGRFAPLTSVRLALRGSCSDEAPECVELVPGAVLHPPAWLGTTGDAQCECEGCERVEPGTYRFVATSCGGAHRVEGEPFVLAR